MARENLSVKILVFGYLSGDLWETYEKLLMGLNTSPSAMILKKKLPIDCREKLNCLQNVELEKPFYIPIVEGDEIADLKNMANAIRNKLGITMNSSQSLAMLLTARSRYFYKRFCALAKKEGIILAEIGIRYEISKDNGNMAVFLPKPESQIDLMIIHQGSKNYSYSLKINNWNMHQSFAKMISGC